MAYLGKGRREDLFVLATELNLKFDKSMTIATLKDLIIGSEDYDELTKNIHSTIVEDRKAREENLRIEEQKEKLRIEEREEKLLFEQLRLDEQKRKYEFELEELRIQTQSKLGADTSKESDTKFLVKEVSKFIHRFDLKEDISLYLKLFERQAQRLNIDQENWVSHLLGLLPTEVSHIIAREPDDKANSYEHIKDLLLKRFKLTPEKFRQLFVTHQKAPERTWIDFYHELNTYFNGWIHGLKIDTFNKLSDIIITDQLKRKTPFEFKEYYLDEWANMNSPLSLFVKKQEYKFTEKNRRYEAPGKFEYNRKDKKFPASTNYNKHYEAPVTKYESVQRYQDSAQKGYYNKNYEKHSNHNASKHAQTNYSKSQKFKEPPKPKETCTFIVKEGLRTKEIFFGKVKITTLIDSGSSVSLLRENTSRRIMDPTKLSKNKMLLTGIGEAQVTTIGSFEHEFKIDDENYSLTWQKDKLKFEAVIGSDLLEQASISFTKEGVKFNKYENHAQLMQISAENLQEELDLRHVENRQIKKELEKLIQDYKPEKTASTDVTMRIILKDEEPVCQHPRRLAFTERQEVNKQIEEMAKELLEQREFLRNDAKKNIETLQSENRKTYNRRRKKASLYKEGDLVAIQRTQFGAGLKLRPKFLGPYKVTKLIPRIVASLRESDEIDNLIKEVVDLVRQINLEVDSDEVQELLDSPNKELTIDEFVEKHEQDVKELECLDLHSKDLMKIGNLTKVLSLIERGYKF
ncbi:transposon Ty3-I Gag-Pol polyprotein [Trichonephila clavipes]|nr:transposon Ty3-I Gag-Pol polyprotein [Trichonephila clavipes]